MYRQYHCVILLLSVTVTPATLGQSANSDRQNLPRNKPNIIVIIADDMGWNDPGFHGSSQIPTPNIDALAYNGIILNRFYTQYTCTPSRTAFLTGNYPIRSGMQGYPLEAGENRSLPMDMPTMPEQLKKLGYKTHLVGKWHLGAAYRSSTPTGRGFDSHFGYWNGFIDYFKYTSFSYGPNGSKTYGYDLHDGFETVWNAQGQYATHLFTDKATEIIDKHDVKDPLFLVVAHLAPHGGLKLDVPDENVTNQKYGYIQDHQRRLYADVVNLMDESVGKIVNKLAEKNILENSIVLFFSDNGGQSVGMYINSASNWPLRGVKFTNFEGGVRCAAAIFSPLFEKRSYVSNELIHLTDWLPTFYTAAGGDLKDLGKIDGVDQWESLSQNLPTSRTEVLVNINEIEKSSAIVTDRGRYKFLQGDYDSDGRNKYFGDSGRSGGNNPDYDITAVLQSHVNAAASSLNFTLTQQQILQLRSDSDISWCRNDTYAVVSPTCSEGCLFNLEEAPCETVDIADEEPEVVARLKARIQEFQAELVRQKRKKTDPASNPIKYNNTWCTWLDDKLCVKTPDLAIPLQG